MSAIERPEDSIEVAQALEKARGSLRQILQIEAITAYNLRLEEVRYNDDAEEWLITYGYDVPVEETPGSLITKGALAQMFPTTTRVYSVIVLHGFDGRFKEMRMRETAKKR